MSTVIRNSFLASAIALPRGGTIDDDDRYRRYKSNIRTSSTIGGNEDHRMVQVLYEIGRVHSTKARALARPADGATLVEASYLTAGALSEDFVGLSKKFTNFSADFAHTSLAGIVERLARGLAAHSVFGNLNSTDLRGGRALIVNALGTYDGPVNSLTNTVFIPRLVNSALTGDVFSILANAVSGEGSSVATDLVELDAVTRQPILQFIDSGGFARAVVDALRILGSNMIASDQGPLFALALTRGIHRTLSVVGHTDEGGITRDLLRTSGFAPPFGGVHYGLEPYTGLPALASNAAQDVAVYVDTLALMSAAIVPHCDPGQTFDGRWFPSFILGTSAADDTTRPGFNLPGTSQMADRNRAQLLASFAPFAQSYVRGLGRLFAAEGDHSVATSFFCAAVSVLGSDNRHLRYPSVSPWFWIEPTSLIPHDFLGTIAETEGFASHGGRDALRTKAAWEDIVPAGPGDTAFSGYHALMRGARACWFLLHWLGNQANGLGAVSVRQLDPNAVIHPGPNDINPEVRDRVENGDPLSAFLWVRGQSPFPAPGEFLNIAGTLGFHVKHLTLDDEGIPTEEHLPSVTEFASTTVTIHVGRPVGIVTGASNAPDAQVRRSKTRAARELAASTTRARMFGRPDLGAMATLTTAPTLRSRVAPRPEVTPPDPTPGGAAQWARGIVGAGGGITDGLPQPDGVPRPPVPHYASLRAPQLSRPGGNQPGGGGVPVPAPPSAPGHGPDGDGDDRAPPVPVAPAPGAAPLSGPDPQ
uniref:Capsid protein n=1 Tax=Hymenoscyphus albidus victorivirus 1 TaxID=3074143 RepID=A0AA51YHV0_9VIRU|nr:capsid protein [Hymenoscyphus albidus victorivirus 1]